MSRHGFGTRFFWRWSLQTWAVAKMTADTWRQQKCTSPWRTPVSHSFFSIAVAPFPTQTIPKNLFNAMIKQDFICCAVKTPLSSSPRNVPFSVPRKEAHRLSPKNLYVIQSAFLGFSGTEISVFTRKWRAYRHQQGLANHKFQETSPNFPQRKGWYIGLWPVHPGRKYRNREPHLLSCCAEMSKARPVYASYHLTDWTRWRTDSGGTDLQIEHVLKPFRSKEPCRGLCCGSSTVFHYSCTFKLHEWTTIYLTKLCLLDLSAKSIESNFFHSYNKNSSFSISQFLEKGGKSCKVY